VDAAPADNDCYEPPNHPSQREGLRAKWKATQQRSVQIRNYNKPSVGARRTRHPTLSRASFHKLWALLAIPESVGRVKARIYFLQGPFFGAKRKRSASRANSALCTTPLATFQKAHFCRALPPKRSPVDISLQKVDHLSGHL